MNCSNLKVRLSFNWDNASNANFNFNAFINIYFHTLGVGQSKSRRNSFNETIKRKLSISREKDCYQRLGQEVQCTHLIAEVITL